MVTGAAQPAAERPDARVLVDPRAWAAAAGLAHVVFVVAWLVAPWWQGPTYSALAHSISDMYADGAPGGLVLVVVLTLCGITCVGFAAFSLRPALGAAGWTAPAGWVLLALSIYGLGDVLTPFERLACRQADAGCTPQAQLGTLGGVLDTILSTFGVLLFLGACFFLAAAARRVPGWRWLVVPMRVAGALTLVLFLATGLLGVAHLAGLGERLLAATGAATIVLLALGVRRAPRS